MIVIDLSEQKAVDDDPRAIQQINFSINLDRSGNTTVFLFTEKAKETSLENLIPSSTKNIH